MIDFPTTNPLHDLHVQAEAEFQPYGDLQIVSTFGEPQAEYAAIHKSCGLMDEAQRGFIEVTGSDRLTFLNSLLTNATWDRETKKPIASGSVVSAFLLNAKTGRIICDVRALELGDRTLLELDGRLVISVLAALERYVFGEKVTLKSLAASHHEIALLGPLSVSVLQDVFDDPQAVSQLQNCRCFATRLLGHDIVAWRDDALLGDVAAHLVVPNAAARAVWMNFVSRYASTSEDIGKRRLRPIGWAAFNAARIEAATPLFGIDFDDNALPAETGRLINRAVSFTKGCYPGQEVVARMHARSQVAKQIIAFQMTGNELPIAGSHLFDAEQNQIGVVTSSTISPILSGRAIGLAMVKKPHFAVGAKFRIPAEGALREAVVVEPPFVVKKEIV